MAPPDPSPFAGLDPATLAVRDLGGASRQLTGDLARAMGMGLNDMSALGELVQHGHLGAAELADRLGIRSASATVLIDRLEQVGHVRRVRDTDDRRRVTVVATASAQTATYEAWGPVIQAIDAVARRLSDDDRAAVVDFLGRVTNTINDHRRGVAEPGDASGTTG